MVVSENSLNGRLGGNAEVCPADNPNVVDSYASVESESARIAIPVLGFDPVRNTRADSLGVGGFSYALRN